MRACACVRACVSSDDELEEWCDHSHICTSTSTSLHISIRTLIFIKTIHRYGGPTALIAVHGAGRVLQSKVTNDYLGIGLAGRRRQPHLRGGVKGGGGGGERDVHNVNLTCVCMFVCIYV